jgi:putative addiction module component (TIGR02574 family)
MINEKFKKQALELSNRERAELAHMLIHSLHPEKEVESVEAWSKELKKRIDRYEQGESSAKP